MKADVNTQLTDDHEHKTKHSPRTRRTVVVVVVVVVVVIVIVVVVVVVVVVIVIVVVVVVLVVVVKHHSSQAPVYPKLSSELVKLAASSRNCKGAYRATPRNSVACSDTRKRGVQRPLAGRGPILNEGEAASKAMSST